MTKIIEKPFWWEDALPVDLPDAELPKRTDALVIGGGFAGLMAALELRKAGVEVTLLEKHWPGHGASSRNCGFLMRSVKGTISSDLNSLFHGVKRSELLLEGRKAHDSVLDLIKRENIDCGLRQRGRLVMATSKSAFQTMESSLEEQDKHLGKLDAYMLSQEDLYTEMGGRASEMYYGAKVEPRHYDLNPGQLAAGMIQRISELGVTICSATQLESVEPQPNGNFRVTTDKGDITAEHVVWGTQGYSGAETGSLQKKIFPALAHAAVTEPLPKDLLKELLPNLRAVVDTKQMFFCFRPCDKDARLVMASDYFRMDDGITQANRILNSYRKLFPQLNDVKPEYCWRGHIPMTSDELPHIWKNEGMHYCSSSSFSMAIYLGSKMAKRILNAGDTETVFDNMTTPNFPFYSGDPSLITRVVKNVFNGLDYLNVAAPK
jgi:glycine/D-amino acid oxidase-like deaminating enzyme